MKVGRFRTGDDGQVRVSAAARGGIWVLAGARIDEKKIALLAALGLPPELQEPELPASVDSASKGTNSHL